MSGKLSRSLLLIVACVAPLAWAAPSVDQITDAAAGTEIENSRFQFEGEVNANAVYVRSGPSDNDYATAKLDKGAKVTVVGIKFEWLKVMPPEGSFCYVAKAYVERRGGGAVTLGRVTNTLNVRVGSSLLPMKTKVAAKLEPGQDVEIIGEQDEYFKVKPPEGVFLFVNKQFVDPVRRVEVPGIAATPQDGAKPKDTEHTPPAVAANPPPAEVTTPPVENPQPASSVPPMVVASSETQAQPDKTDSTGGETVPPTVTDNPSNTSAAITDASTVIEPATQPSAAVAAKAPEVSKPKEVAVAADVEFDRLEAVMKEASAKPIEQQPVPEMLAGYQKLVDDSTLPESMRRIAEYRVQTLTVHNENRQMVMSHQREIADKEARRLALKAEGEELMDRIKTTGILFYTAVGTLRPSSLQNADGTLYRLTDPITGRTVVYLKSTDPALARMVGLFVGVKGEVVDDGGLKLKWITPTDIVQVDQQKVNRSIAARLMPPSLMPGGTLAGNSSDEVGR